MALITKIKTVYSEVIAALGFTPENSANKGQPNGYAGLDAGGRVPAAQLPSYVDDVQEFANLATFPNPGAAGIIYLALDTNIIYRWSGSTYVEIASGDVAWADITGKPAFGTMSSQNANNVTITGGTLNVTSVVSGNLSLSNNEITSTQAFDDILITPTGIGALKVQNRITLEDRLSFGPTDPQGSYFANNAEYLQSGFLSAWQYIQNGTATKVEFDNGAALSIANAPSGTAGSTVLSWTEVLNISSSGNVVTGNWTAGVIAAEYGGTGLSNVGATLDITGNASISGVNTGDQTNITGNAGTATALQTARTINGVAFDGTVNITIPAATPNNLTIASPLTGGSFNGSASTTIGLPTANSTVTGALSSTDWATFNTKQAALSGAGIVKSTNGTISYLADNTANWDAAYNRSLTSATVTGTATKTLTLNQQGGTNITASWSDLNTDAVTSVFGRTGAVVATEGDYSLTQLSDVNLASPANGQLLQNNGTQWVNWTPNYLTSNQVVTLSGDVTGTGATAITATLANTTVTAGTYGNATQVPQITVDSKGRATSAGNVTITPAWSSVTGTPTTISGYGITDAVTLTGTQTLTNKTVTDATFTIQDDADNTKKAKFQASGITTATTRTYTFPNVDGTIVTTGDTGSVTNTMLAGSIADTKLSTISTAGKVSNAATTATSANTASAIVARNASGNFTAGTITANLTGLASTSTTLTAGNADFYTNTLPANTGGTDTYMYVGRWTTTQTREKLSLKILYNNSSLGDTRRTSEYMFFFNTSDGVAFATGSTGNFYGWGRGFTLGEGGALDTANTRVVQVSNTQYDIYVSVLTGIASGIGGYVINISGGSWTHSGTNFGSTIPTGNTYILYLDNILTNYMNATFYTVAALDRITAAKTWDAANNQASILMAGDVGSRIEFQDIGLAIPAVTTRSVGTKIVTRPTVAAAAVDFAIGATSSSQWYSVDTTSSFHTFYTGTTVSLRNGNSGTSSRGVVYQGNSAITTQNTGTTLTIAQILTLVIQSTPTANINFNLPTGTNVDAGVMASLETNRSFTWSIVNLATGFTVTVLGATGNTYVGNTVIAASSSASFRTLKTGTNTFSTYRI